MKEKILVVDDTQRNLDAMKHVLNRSDWLVHTCISGDEALSWLMDNEDVSLILLDVQMPGINGFDLAQLIRQNHALLEVPIIFISAVYESKEYITRGFTIGASDYIVKPVDNDILIQRISVFLKIYREHLDQLEAREQSEQKAEEADRSSAAKSRFLANMSHEIRTPLHAILNMSEMLKNQDLPKDAIYKAEKIHSVGKNLLGIINDILDYSKIEAEQMALVKQDFELTDITNQISTIMQSPADKHLELLITLPEKPIEFSLFGDSFRIIQILTNLVGNSIKFTPDGGLVEVRIEKIRETTSSLSLRFNVIDTGIGIEPEITDNLFNPFTQADDSNTRKYGGTGLGLSISKQLVELHGGELQYTRNQEKGSTFWFELDFPIHAHTEASSLSEITQALIMDDELFTRKAIGSVCTYIGLPSYEFSDSQALKDFIYQHPDYEGNNCLLLCDWKMPEISGIELISQLRRELPADKCPKMVLVSGFDLKNFKDVDLTSIDDFLHKPVEAFQLRELIDNINHSQTGLSTSTIHSDEEFPLKGVKLLIVDDVAMNLEIAEECFISAGAEVHTSDNGQQAIEWLLANPDKADLVLMDIQMPVMNGLEATKLIRQTPEIRDIPVIAMSANAMQEHQDEARNIGFDDYVTKPFFPDDIADKLLSYVHGGK